MKSIKCLQFENCKTYELICHAQIFSAYSTQPTGCLAYSDERYTKKTLKKKTIYSSKNPINLPLHFLQAAINTQTSKVLHFHKQDHFQQSYTKSYTSILQLDFVSFQYVFSIFFFPTLRALVARKELLGI